MTDCEQLRKIVDELKKLGHDDAYLDQDGIIYGTGDWVFYVEDGELTGCDQEGNRAATLSTVVSAESIHEFLKQGEPIGEI